MNNKFRSYLLLALLLVIPSHQLLLTSAQVPIRPQFNDLSMCSDPSAPRDGLLSVDEPKFVSVTDADQVWDDDELIIGIQHDGNVRGYPLGILRWHEIVNDQINGDDLSVTYCPLTGTGMFFPLNHLGNVELGVTGMLYENNLVMYDRETNSCFVQMLGFGMSGDHQGLLLDQNPIIETTWGTWKTLFPDSEVMSIDTEHNHREAGYTTNNYESYESSATIFHASNYFIEDEPYSWYHPKQKTLIITREVIKQNFTDYIIPLVELEDEQVVNLQVNNDTIVVIYDKLTQLAMVYDRTNGTEYRVGPRDSNGFLTMVDNNDETWSILGEHQASNQTLTQHNGFIGYWFAATTLYLHAQIYTDGEFVQYEAPNLTPNVYNPDDPANLRVLVIPAIALALIVTMTIIIRRKTR